MIFTATLAHFPAALPPQRGRRPTTSPLDRTLQWARRPTPRCSTRTSTPAASPLTTTITLSTLSTFTNMWSEGIREEVVEVVASQQRPTTTLSRAPALRPWSPPLLVRTVLQGAPPSFRSSQSAPLARGDRSMEMALQEEVFSVGGGLVRAITALVAPVVEGTASTRAPCRPCRGR